MVEVLRRFEQWLDVNAELDGRCLLYAACGWTMGTQHRDEPTPRPTCWPDIRTLTVRELLSRHTLLARMDETPPRALTFAEALALYAQTSFEAVVERVESALKALRKVPSNSTNARLSSLLAEASGGPPPQPAAGPDFWERLVRYLLREEMEMTVLEAMRLEPHASGFYGLQDERAGTLLPQTLERYPLADDGRVAIGNGRPYERLRRRWFCYPQVREDRFSAWILGVELCDSRTVVGYATCRVVQAAQMSAADYIGEVDALDVDATMAAHAAIEALNGDVPAGTTLYLLGWELQPHLRGGIAGFELLKDLFTLARRRLRHIDRVAAFLQPAQYLFPLPERAPAGLYEEALDAAEKLRAAWLKHQPQKYAGEQTSLLLLHRTVARGGLWGHLDLLARYYTAPAAEAVAD